MALVFVGKMNIPNYTALSTDIDTGAISGTSMIGATIFLTDTAEWKIVLDDLTLGDYAIPATFSGSIALGTVDISQVTPGTTNGVAAGVSAAVADGIGNFGSVLTAPGSVNSAPLIVLDMGFNGATWDKIRVANVFKDVNAVAITTIASLWTPTTGKKFRLMGGTISVSGACSVLFEDNGAGATIFRTPQLLANTPYSFDLGNGILSGAINRILKGTASTGTVTLTGFLWGTEE